MVLIFKAINLRMISVTSHMTIVLTLSANYKRSSAFARELLQTTIFARYEIYYHMRILYYIHLIFGYLLRVNHTEN